MCHVAEQLIEFADTLLNVADLRFAFNDERFLEVDFILGGEAELFLLLQLLLLACLGATAGTARLAVVFERCAAGGRCCALFLKGGSLKILEFSERGLEFAVEFALSESLRGL